MPCPKVAPKEAIVGHTIFRTTVGAEHLLRAISWCAGCSRNSATVCRPTSIPPRAPSIRTGTRSSDISTTGPMNTWPPGNPVISIEPKKKGLVGPYKNGRRELSPAGQPEPVKVHDFIDPALGKANPYGVYDIAADAGWVSVGTDHDTAQFAVATIRRWWQSAADTYPDASRLLITADGGGSNGYRTRLWKTELVDLAAATGLQVTVCHLPPGTSKWNKIEHRLFSHISMNWRGRPLTSHDVIVQPIAATTTRTGLTVHAALDTDTSPTGLKIPDAQIKALHDTGALHRHDWHPEWNYTLRPPQK